jgi:hypothetical protein
MRRVQNQNNRIQQLAPGRLDPIIRADIRAGLQILESQPKPRRKREAVWAQELCAHFAAVARWRGLGRFGDGADPALEFGSESR